MIRPTVVENIARRTIEARQMTTLLTVPATNTALMSVFSLPSMVNGPGPIMTMAPSSVPGRTNANGSPFGNNQGGIDDMKDKPGLSKGGAAAISVVLILRTFICKTFNFAPTDPL